MIDFMSYTINYFRQRSYTIISLIFLISEFFNLLVHFLSLELVLLQNFISELNNLDFGLIANHSDNA